MAEVYAFTTADPSGNESIIGFAHPAAPDVMVPLVSKSMEEMEQYRPFAKKLAEALKVPVNLVKFTSREDVESIS